MNEVDDRSFCQYGRRRTRPLRCVVPYRRHLSQLTAEVPEFRDQVQEEYYVVLPTHVLQDQWEREGPSTTQYRSVTLLESLIPRGLPFVVRHNNDMPHTFRKLGRFRRIAILLDFETSSGPVFAAISIDVKHSLPWNYSELVRFLLPNNSQSEKCETNRLTCSPAWLFLVDSSPLPIPAITYAFVRVSHLKRSYVENGESTVAGYIIWLQSSTTPFPFWILRVDTARARFLFESTLTALWTPLVCMEVKTNMEYYGPPVLWFLRSTTRWFLLQMIFNAPFAVWFLILN